MTKKLTLATETLKRLEDQDLFSVEGGVRNDNGSMRCSKVQGSVCIGCDWPTNYCN